jgi:hypothetical protein
MSQFQDRVRETSIITGTGTLALLGAQTNFITFGTAFPAASTPNVPYAIIDNTNDAWEVGFGTYTLSGATLSRDYVISSSNAGALVNFAAATKDVFSPVMGQIANWSMQKESLDSGEVMLIPSNYMLLRAGNFTENGGTAYVFGDRYYF